MPENLLKEVKSYLGFRHLRSRFRSLGLVRFRGRVAHHFNVLLCGVKARLYIGERLTFFQQLKENFIRFSKRVDLLPPAT